MVMAMDLDAAVALVCRDGAIAFSELRSLGVSKAAMAHRVSTGKWLRPHREVYLVKSLVGDQNRALARAAVLAGPSDAMLSHAAATHLYGIQGVPRPSEVDLLMPRATGHRAIRGIRMHRSDLVEPVMRHGLPVVPAEHALRGLADQLTLPQLLSAIDSALHLGLVTKDSLLALPPPRLLVARATWFRAVDLADGRAESPLESRARLVVIEAGLGPVELQIEVEVNGVIYRIDIGWTWGPLGLEADGKDAHSTAEALLNDRRRQNALFGAGWPLVRCIWEDVTGPPDRLLRDIRQAMAEQRRRRAS
jgi:hypothetical protein